MKVKINLRKEIFLGSPLQKGYCRTEHLAPSPRCAIQNEPRILGLQIAILRPRVANSHRRENDLSFSLQETRTESSRKYIVWRY
jgi:hypothetical protein